MRTSRIAVVPLAAALGVAGCGGSNNSAAPTLPTIQAARTYQLAGFAPAGRIRANVPTTLSFTIRQPSGAPLTRYRHGSGPHTGVHVIFARSDLGTIIHRHPPVDARGRVTDTIVLPTPGRYRVVVDAYPQTNGPQQNFQLFRWLTVAGRRAQQPLPPPAATQTVDGYRFTLVGRPRLRAIQAAFLKFTVTDPSGKPARFTPWYGALAHAIFFRTGSLDYFHTHVCAPGASACTTAFGATRVAGTSTTPGNLTVGVLVPVPGRWRLFVQCEVGGHVLTAPFTLDVR
jgi:hypothetical protein